MFDPMQAQRFSEPYNVPGHMGAFMILACCVGTLAENWERRRLRRPDTQPKQIERFLMRNNDAEWCQVVNGETAAHRYSGFGTKRALDPERAVAPSLLYAASTLDQKAEPMLGRFALGISRASWAGQAGGRFHACGEFLQVLTPISPGLSVSLPTPAVGGLSAAEPDVALPSDQALLGQGEALKFQPAPPAPTSSPESLVSQTQAVTTALLPGLEALTSAKPGPGQGLSWLSEIGWRFFNKDGEVGLVGAQGLDQIKARRGEASLRLSPQALEKVSAYYAAHPEMAQLEKEGALFFDRYGGGVGAFDSAEVARVGLLGQPPESSVPVASLESDGVREALSSFQFLQKVNSHPLAAWLCLQEASPEVRQASLGQLTDLSAEQLAAGLEPAQARRAASRVLEDFQLPQEDRRNQAAALYARLTGPEGSLVSAVQPALFPGSAIELMKVGLTEAPLLESVLSTMKNADYSPEATEAILAWCRALPEPPPGLPLAEELVAQMKSLGGRAGALRALLLPPGSTPGDAWLVCEHGMALNRGTQEDRGQLGQHLAGRLPGSGGAALQGIASMLSAEEAYGFYESVLGAELPTAESVWLKLATVDSAQSYSDKLSGPAAVLTRSLEQALPEPKQQHLAIKAACEAALEGHPWLGCARAAVEALPPEMRASVADGLLRQDELRGLSRAESLPAFDRLLNRLGQMTGEEVGEELGRLDQWSQAAESVSELAAKTSGSSGLGNDGGYLVVGGVWLRRRV